MLYQFVKPLARWILGLNFKRIFLSGLDNIPAKGPVILAANHPTAFIEPCVLASFQKRPLYFLVRGDFFKKKIFSFFLRVLHMIPIFRMKDGGYAKIRKNFTSFDRCFDALQEGKALMILSEGFCIHEKKLRPIRKGTARIAFGAYDKHQLESLQIVPVGVNYVDSDAYRTELMIDFGKPLLLSDYLTTFQKDEPEALRNLTEDLEQAMLQRVIHVNELSDEPLAEQLLSAYRMANYPLHEDALHFSADRLQAEIGIAKRFNAFSAEKKDALKGDLDNLRQERERLGVGEWAFGKAPFSRMIMLALLIVGWPLALVGGAWLALPLLVMQLLGASKGVAIEFRHSIKVASGLAVLLLLNIFLLILCIKFSSWIGLTFLILGPLMIWIAVRYFDLFQLFVKTRKIDSLSSKSLQGLVEQQNSFLEKWIQ